MAKSTKTAKAVPVGDVDNTVNSVDNFPTDNEVINKSMAELTLLMHEEQHTAKTGGNWYNVMTEIETKFLMLKDYLLQNS